MKNLNRYLEDKQFIDWVFNPTTELEEWWSSYKSNHQEENDSILLARKVLNKFKTTEKDLSVEEKILLFSNILKQIETQKDRRKKIKLYVSWMKYAAVAILFFSFGSLLFYESNNFNNQFYSQGMVEPYTDGDARLIRPDGENILLNEKKSVVEYRNDGKVVVNDNVLESNTPPVNKTAAQLNQLIIPYGKTSEIVLPDGTKVSLNAGSRLVYPEVFQDKNREVLLVGEAFFEVTHDAEHPFVVQTTDIRIQVLGTRFNVSAYPADKTIETVLTEGKVRLEKNNASIFSEGVDLKPNELASFNKSTKKASVVNVDPQNYILWKDGLFKFESTDLNRIIKKLERYYNIHFHYSDPVLGTIRISGKLELNENSEEIVNRVAIAASVNIIKKGENYYEIKK